MGWVQLEKNLKTYGYDPEQIFLFSDKYQTTSMLSFYSEKKKRAFFLNLQGLRRNQFSYWPSLFETQKNKIGFFVWIENKPHFQKSWEEKRDDYINQLSNYFEKVEFVALTPLIKDQSGMAKVAMIIKCENCKKEIENKYNYY